MLLLINRGLAEWAIASNAAGALLSPSGAVPLEAFALALGFLGSRLLFAGVFCVSLAQTARELSRSLLSGRERAGSVVGDELR